MTSASENTVSNCGNLLWMCSIVYQWVSAVQPKYFLGFFVDIKAQLAELTLFQVLKLFLITNQLVLVFQLLLWKAPYFARMPDFRRNSTTWIW